MATTADRRAVHVLLVIATLGALVRFSARAPDIPSGGVAYAMGGYRDRPDRDSLRARSARAGRPLGAGERIDLNRADITALDRLPRIGPALAARILRDRDERGDFLSTEDLTRVPGIGSAMAAAIKPHVTFSRVSPRRVSPRNSVRTNRVRLNGATVEELTGLPGIGPGRARAIIAYRERHGPFESVQDLLLVRGIGPATVTRLEGRVRIP